MSAPVNGWTGRVKWVGTKRNPKEKAYLRTDDGTELLAVLDSGADDVVADRIAACLNACAGIASPAALGDLVKAAEERDAHKATIDAVIYASGWDGVDCGIAEWVKHIVAERDAAVAALRKHGRHTLRCMVVAKFPSDEHCTCGLPAALRNQQPGEAL